MTKKCMSVFLAVLSTALFITFVGCDSGGGDGDDNTPTVNISGTWIARTSVGETATLVMTQNGSAVTGTFSSNFGSKGTLSGSVSGTTVNLTLQETNYNRIKTQAKGFVDGNIMTGTFTQSDNDSANFTANKQ